MIISFNRNSHSLLQFRLIQFQHFSFFFLGSSFFLSPSCVCLLPVSKTASSFCFFFFFWPETLYKTLEQSGFFSLSIFHLTQWHQKRGHRAFCFIFREIESNLWHHFLQRKEENTLCISMKNYSLSNMFKKNLYILFKGILSYKGTDPLFSDQVSVLVRPLVPSLAPHQHLPHAPFIFLI